MAMIPDVDLAGTPREAIVGMKYTVQRSELGEVTGGFWQCAHVECVQWQPGLGVVACIRCGTVYEAQRPPETAWRGDKNV